MNKKDDTVYLRHILDAIAKIEDYLQDVDQEGFQQNTLIQDGVIRQTQIIGEAVRRVSFELRVKYPHIPWQDIAGMRSKLVHDYFGVDIEAVWLVAKEDTSTLKENILKILSELKGNGNP